MYLVKTDQNNEIANVAEETGIVELTENLLMDTRTAINSDNVMCFGDGENDAGMLEYAGIGVAMGGASDAVKARADYVTADVDADGIARALEHFSARFV